LFKGCLRGVREYQGGFRVCCVSETAQVERKWTSVSPFDEVITKTTSGSVFISTHMENKRVYRTAAATEAACPATAPNLGVSKTDAGFSYATGICTYSDTNNLLLVGRCRLNR